MYLLGTREFADLAGRDTDRLIAQWLEATKPGEKGLFISVVSVGIVASGIEDLDKHERGAWRRLLAEARRNFVDASGVIDVDLPIVDVWASELRGLDLIDEDPDTGERWPLSEDERFVLATAIARQLTLVSQPRPYLEEVCERTTLTVVHP